MSFDLILYDLRKRIAVCNFKGKINEKRTSVPKEILNAVIETNQILIKSN